MISNSSPKGQEKTLTASTPDTGGASFFKFRFDRLYHLTLFVLCLYFGANLLGSPMVTPLYLLISVFVLVGVVLCDLEDSLTLIFIYFFIEGQGRVVLGYHPLSRIIFDLIVSVCVLLHFIRTKKLFPSRGLPKPFMVLFFCHLCVFTVSLFNVKGVGPYLGLPMIKIYVLPFILFFFIYDRSFDFESKAMKRVVQTILLLVIANGVISIVQYQGNSPFMVNISSYYGTIGKFSNFTKTQFRPFGTTYIPGGISTYLYLTLGMFFLAPRSVIMMVLAVSLSIITLVLCQVRTALIQYVLLLVVFLFIQLKTTKLSAKVISRFLGVLLLFGISLSGLMYQISTGNSKQVDNTFSRTLTVFDKDTLSRARLGPSDIIRIILYNLEENPFGLGPGRTNPVTKEMGEAIDNDPVYNLDFSWNYDNLWVTIVIDFGFGAIFYALMILSMPWYLLSMSFTLLRRKKMKELKVLLIATTTVTLIVLANWGGVGIPYNPVSFMFWFWCAIGFRAYQNSLDTLEAKVKS